MNVIVRFPRDTLPIVIDWLKSTKDEWETVFPKWEEAEIGDTIIRPMNRKQWYNEIDSYIAGCRKPHMGVTMFCGKFKFASKEDAMMFKLVWM